MPERREKKLGGDTHAHVTARVYIYIHIAGRRTTYLAALMDRSILSLGLYRAWLTTKAQRSLLGGEQSETAMMRASHRLNKNDDNCNQPAMWALSLSSGVLTLSGTRSKAPHSRM